MQTRQVIALIIVAAIIALAFGTTLGYSVSSGRTSTITKTGATSTMTQIEATTVTTSFFLGTSITSNSSSKNFLFNETFDVYVNYSGAWGLSYQTHLGFPTPSDTLVESGNFFGHSPANESVTVTENYTLFDIGYLTCFQAQKLDNSSSLLTLGFTSSNSENKTSLAFGTASLCVGVFTDGTITTSTISSGLNKIVFQESGACDPPAYVAPWSVTLGEQTLAQPPNATLPIPNDSFSAAPNNSIYSQMVFYVPNGTYHYSISPSSMLAGFPSAGTISINSSEVISIGAPPISCTVSTST